MKKLLLLLIIPFLSFGQTLELSVSENAIKLNETIEVTYTFYGDDIGKNFKIQNFENFKIVRGPSISTSITNGKWKQQKTYILQPLVTGDWIIPSASIEYNNLEVFSNNYIITVLDSKTFNCIISIVNSKLYINKKNIHSDTPTVEIKKILGNPNRISAGYNNIWIYDDLGLSIYLSPQTNSLKAITIQFENQNRDNSPKFNFKGKLLVNGQIVSKQTSEVALGKILEIAPDHINPFEVTHSNDSLSILIIYNHSFGEELPEYLYGGDYDYIFPNFEIEIFDITFK